MFIYINGSFNQTTSYCRMAINVRSIIFVKPARIKGAIIGVRDYGNIYVDSSFSDVMKSIKRCGEEE